MWCRWWRCLWCRPRRHPRISITVGIVTLPFPKGFVMAAFQLTDIQHVSASLEVDDGAGNPVTLPASAVTWTSSDPSIVTITPSPDGTSADVVAAGPLGTSQVTVSVQLD